MGRYREEKGGGENAQQTMSMGKDHLKYKKIYFIYVFPYNVL